VAPRALAGLNSRPASARAWRGKARALPSRRDVLSTAGMTADAGLDAEARLLARYLTRREPPPELVARYVAASGTLFPQPGPPAEEAALAFARRHPWSVGLLDGAAGLLRPGGRFRGKVLVMAAILEASPAFADDFLPRSVSLPELVARLAISSVLAAVDAAAGVVLWPFATRTRA
jgi:hypothetical protein